MEADLIGATFVHGTSCENDPQLHAHCAIFNIAKTRDDGKWRAHRQYPVYSWKKAAGALFRAYMAWDLQQGLGVRMEQYGPNAEFNRAGTVRGKVGATASGDADPRRRGAPALRGVYASAIALSVPRSL